MVPKTALSGNKWLFAPTTRDEQIVEMERERLMLEWAGVRVTRADAIRSLFLRAAEIDRREREAELEALPGAQIGSMVASRESEKLTGA